MTHAHSPAHLRVERRLVQTCFSVFVQQYAIYLTWRPVSCTPISKPPEQADITSNHPAYISKSTPRSRLRRRIDTILNATATRQFCIRPINNPCYCQRCLPHGLISSPTSTRIFKNSGAVLRLDKERTCPQETRYESSGKEDHVPQITRLGVQSQR